MIFESIKNHKSKIFIAFMLLILIFSLSVSFASDGGDNLKLNNESGDLKSQIDDEFSAADVVQEDESVIDDSQDNQLGATDESNLEAEPGQGTFSQLASLTATNRYLTLDKNYVRDGYHTGYGSNIYYYITISKAISVDGQGHSLDGEGDGPIFSIRTHERVTFKNVVFMNTNSYTFTSIYVHNGQVDFENCSFINVGGGISLSGEYGSTNVIVQSIFKDLKFINCKLPSISSKLKLVGVFDNITIANTNYNYKNGLTDYSGAIRSEYYLNATFNNIKFINNTGGYGGAMHIEGECHANFTNVEFINNTATRGGGAIYTTTDIDGVFKNVKFIGNNINGTYYGGAIYSNKILTAKFENVEFINNSAGYSGGAICVNELRSSFNNVIFKGNKLESTSTNYGGAIYVQKNFNATFTNVTFTDNHASSTSSSQVYGGAIAAPQVLEAHFKDVTFENNTAYSNSPYYGYGGAIYMTGNSAVFENVNFTNNEALVGGAISYTGLSSISFVDVNFNSNKARYSVNNRGYGGGALYLGGSGIAKSTAEFRNASFFNNSAVNYAGAISFYSITLKINDSLFKDNNAGKEGGAIFLKSSVFNVTNSEFTGNAAPEGSAVLISEYYQMKINVDECNFTRNRGNVIDTLYSYSGAADMAISNSNFDSNEGDAIISKFNTNVTNCNFTNNKGRAMFFKVYDYNYGTIYDRHNYVDRVVCINNTADIGSAIRNFDTNLTVSNSVFLKNKAGSTSLVVDYDKFDHVLKVDYISGNNYINAIESRVNLTFKNVTYFNYVAIVNSDDEYPVMSYGPINSTLSIEVYDDETHMIDAYDITCTGQLTEYPYRTPIIHHIVASHIDDDYYEEITGEYTYLWGDFDELQRLVLATPEGGTLDLPRNFTYIIGLDTITEGVFINRTITINGNGYTINALNQSRIFRLEADSITLSDIRFVNASGLDGSFIYGYDVNFTSIDKCVFDNFNTYSPEYLDYNGEAIWLSGSTANISNSQFNNLVAYYGGAIYFNGTLFTVYNSEFNNCRAEFGGAVYVDEAALDNDITRSTFTNCSATYSGGAVFWNADYGIISDSNFINNSIERIYEPYYDEPFYLNGGGAVLWNANGGMITGSNFTGNRAIVDAFPRFNDALCGGAVLLFGHDTNIVESVFTQNYAQSGGAVAIMNRTYTPVYPRYIKTVAALEGLGGFDSDIINSTFIDNFAQYGGAVMLKSYKNDIVESKFYNNTAYLGGAVILEGMNGTISESLFDSNAAHLGGAVVSGFNNIFYDRFEEYDYNTGDVIVTLTPYPVYSGDYNKIVASQFTSNQADSAGAVLWIDENGVISDNTLFKSNSASDSFARYSDSFERCYGEQIDQSYYESIPADENSGVMGLVPGLIHKDFAGALYWIGKNGLVYNVEFVENSALNGGAMLQEISCVLIDSSRFIKNHAEKGGAIWKNNDSYIINSNFTQNNATLGGAVYWNGSNSQIDTSQFIDNRAHFGGAIYVVGEFNTLMNSELRLNKAGYGSAIYLDARGLTITSTTLLENQADSTSLKVNVSTTDDDIVVDAVLVGGDNLMNAIYTLSSNYHLNNVTYWRIEGIVNTDDLVPPISDLESGQNITVELFSHNTTVPISVSNLTDNNGYTRISIPIHSGRYVVLTSHKEDNYYRPINDTAVVEFELLDPVISITAEDIYYKQNATVTVSCRDTATGNITLYVEGQKHSTVELVDGHAHFIVENLQGGSHNFTAYYSGDIDFESASIEKKFTVMPIPSNINVTSAGGKYKDPISFHVEIGPDEITGEILITIKNEYGESVSINDVRAFTHVINNLTVGKHNITVYYEGSNNYLPSTNYTVFEVTPIDLPASAYANPDEIPSNLNTTFSIEVPTDFDGQVRITADGISRTYNVTGSTVLIFDKLFLGDKIATIDFFGDKDYNNLTLTAPFKIVKPAGSVTGFGTVNADNMTRGLNSPYDYQAAFLDYDGNVLINIDVAFIVNGKEYRAVTDKDGIAQLKASHLPIGVYDIKSINLLTGEESTRKLSIVKRISANKDVTADFASGKYFTVKVWGDDGKPAPQGEFVSMSIGKDHYVCKIDSNGIARLKITFNPKTYKVITEYKGYKVTNKIVVKQTLKLVKKTVKVKKGKKLVLKAKLKWSNGKAIKGKKIVFKFNGKTYNAKTNAKGIAKVTIKKKVTKKLKKGKKYKFTASYLKNTVKGKVKVKK